MLADEDHINKYIQHKGRVHMKKICFITYIHKGNTGTNGVILLSIQ